jgi:hypothetical protein
MAYTFQDVYIQFFDVNITPVLLGEQRKAVMKTPFAFLADAKKYAKMQLTDAGTLTDHFLVQRYPVVHLNDSEVWRRYLQTTTGEDHKYWLKQVPFYTRLRKHELTFSGRAAQAEHVTKFDSYLLHNALGWSTRVEFRIKMPMKTKELKDLVNYLKSEGTTPFTLNGEEYSLKEIYKLYKDTLEEDGFFPTTTAVRPDFWNLSFVDTPDLDGEHTNIEDLALSDLDELFDILFAKHAEIEFAPDEEGIVKPASEGLSVTVFGPDQQNLSVMHPKVGVFTFFQDVIGQPSLEPKVICYAKNVCDFTWLYRQWEQYALTVKELDANPEMAAFAASGVKEMNRLKSFMKNETILTKKPRTRKASAQTQSPERSA